MSKLWTSEALLKATGGRLTHPFNATGVSIDTRTLHPGDLFVALVGENSDGHAHVAAALEKGAAGCMVHGLPDGLSDDAPLLQVVNTLDGLGALAAFARARFAGKLIAVTGSVGKTTTKEMLRAILTTQGKTWAAEASHNNHWGVPLTLARLPPNHRFGVVEIGMNHAGEIAPLALLARPHVAVITSISDAHIGHLGSRENIKAEKLTIRDGLEPSGILLVPDRIFDDVIEGMTHPVWRFGHGRNGLEVLIQSHGTEAGSVTIQIAGEDIRFVMAAQGTHMAEDAAAAVGGAVALGVPPQAAAYGLNGFAALKGRGEQRVIPAKDGTALLLDESYNASPVAVRAALGVLKGQAPARRIAVLGDMLELGDHAEAEHLGLASDLRDSADLIFLCGPLSRGLFDHLLRQGTRVDWASDSTALAPKIAAAIRPGDAVLVKGSLGSRMAVIVRVLEQKEK